MQTFNHRYHSFEYLEEFAIKQELKKHPNILVQVFTGICELAFIEQIVFEIKKILPNIKIIGSTTSGEIDNAESLEKTTVLSFSIFEHTTIATHSTEVKTSSYQTAKNLIENFDKTKTAKVMISFTDGLHINGEEYINAFHDYNENLIVAGGLAGDNSQFIQTIVFTQEKILINGVVAALLYNDNLSVVTQASFGWKSIGKTMTITKAQGNRVYQIDNMSATSIYAKYLGEDVKKRLPSVGVEFPLLIAKDDIIIPRAVVGKYEDDSLVFAGNITEGDKVTFGYGNVQEILHYSESIYKNKDLQQSESIFVYSCMARLNLLQENINSELQPLSNICTTSGFFTYGEFYSNTNLLEHELLNQTMTILALREDEITFKKEIIDFDNITVKHKENLTLKALSHLISQTSKELEDTNIYLEEKIKREVKKSRQKDQVMLQQSKLAQMGEMISMIAHQWRQPLATISSLSIGMNLQARLDTLDIEETIKLTSNITEQSQFLSTTIDDFREFFRPKREKKETNFNEIVQSVLNIIEIPIKTRNIQIIKNLNAKNNFNTYPNEVKQVVLNLIKNAEDALTENDCEDPYIKISTYELEDKNILEVEDNGGGIPEKIKEKIFEPYFSTKMQKDGTGLGLYMSKSIIEEHCNGKLTFFNSDEGAIFKIILQTF